MTSPTEVADRRATVRRLAKGGASNRQIAAQLGVSKDTVRRDLSQEDAPAGTVAQRLAQQVAHTEAVMSQLCAAVQAAVEARPAYTLADDATAQRWCAELRAASGALAHLAGAFAEYYPCATASADEPQGGQP
ncbi:helix-turn-helix domain-containing protein [Streptomyces sp. H27-H5]|uniref:helix-turn-helix domain-containing protein n=1 Tax=Streptomyces sp. H27-H5 TaxID=2996460 RepID=UPI0022706D8B|nr:helix-turn-helix domain-containing protein [Streptomyces sp. H27-H5]MCY0961553.1 helix-turn-helix domain-containing protein [Streptomyces sp. H27-H5]